MTLLLTYSPPHKLDTEGTAAVLGLGVRPDGCITVSAMPAGPPAVMPNVLPPVMPRGLPPVMSLSALFDMAALLATVPPGLAGKLMPSPRDKLGLAGTAELPVLRAIPMKEGNTALLPCLPETVAAPLCNPGDSVALHDNNVYLTG